MREPRRFWSKVDVGEADECWEWLASKYGKGYGRFWIHSKQWAAHRVAWVLTFGPIPEGLLVCHHCDSPGCCNPYHLFLGTHADNMADATKKDRVPKGEQVYNSKLTEDQVLDIRELYATGEWTQRELAEEFGVVCSTVTQIVNRGNWKWLI